MSLEILDPVQYTNWDQMVLSLPKYSFFHSSSWAGVLSESYGYNAFYFTVLDKGKLGALVPLMEVNSVLTGKRGVSLPFTDYCDPLVSGSVNFKNLFDSIVAFGKKRGWQSIEIRGGQNHFPMAEPSAIFLGHILDLSQTQAGLFAGLRDSTRRNIKKSIGEGVKVQICNSLESAQEFYRLNCLTRRKHGLPPQPYRFFQKVYDRILSRGLGFVTLASHEDRTIAGSVFFHFGDQGIYKYGASDMEFQDLRANNLVIWEAIRWFCDHGYRTLCFGRTEAESKGLQQFKVGWGTRDCSLHYFKYDLRKMEFAAPRIRNRSISTLVFQRLPIPVLNLAGSVLYRHMG